MTAYADFHRLSISSREQFWGQQAQLIDWHTQPTQICDYSNPPFAKWFVGGTTNLCHNAVDRHLLQRADQAACIPLPNCMPRCRPWRLPCWNWACAKGTGY